MLFPKHYYERLPWTASFPVPQSSELQELLPVELPAPWLSTQSCLCIKPILAGHHENEGTFCPWLSLGWNCGHVLLLAFPWGGFKANPNHTIAHDLLVLACNLLLLLPHVCPRGLWWRLSSPMCKELSGPYSALWLLNLALAIKKALGWRPTPSIHTVINQNGQGHTCTDLWIASINNTGKPSLHFEGFCRHSQAGCAPVCVENSDIFFSVLTLIASFLTHFVRSQLLASWSPWSIHFLLCI